MIASLATAVGWTVLLLTAVAAVAFLLIAALVAVGAWREHRYQKSRERQYAEAWRASHWKERA